MFDKIKGMANKAAENVQGKNEDNIEQKIDNDENTVENTESGEVQKESALSGAFSKTMSTATKSIIQSAKESVKDFSIMDKVNAFCAKSVELVTDVDKYLSANNSPYEVSTFKVNASAGLHAGMSLDINFAKTAVAKTVKQNSDQFLQIINPKTNNSFKIPRTSVSGKLQAKVKDPSSGEILLVDTTSGKVIENNT